jgi:hypothetical protein
MASPTINMFTKVERACYEILKRDLFPEFSSSENGVTSALDSYMKDMLNLHKKETKGQKKGGGKSSNSNCNIM